MDPFYMGMTESGLWFMIKAPMDRLKSRTGKG